MGNSGGSSPGCFKGWAVFGLPALLGISFLSEKKGWFLQETNGSYRNPMVLTGTQRLMSKQVYLMRFRKAALRGRVGRF